MIFFVSFQTIPMPAVIWKDSIVINPRQSTSLSIFADEPLCVQSSNQELRILDNQSVVTITVVRKKLLVNGVLIPQNQLCLYCPGIFFINNQPLTGYIFIAYHRNKLLVAVINHPKRHLQKTWSQQLWASRTYDVCHKNSIAFGGDYSISGWKSKIALIEKSVQNRVKKEYPVRVLLNEKNRRDTASWNIESEDGFIIIEQFGDGTIKQSVCDRNAITCMMRRGIFFCQSKRVTASRITIIPRNNRCLFNNKLYPGHFIFVVERENVSVINTVALEEYIAAVLHSESWPGWPLEVNKAFAIACRSYVLAMVVRAQKSKKPYHIKDTNQHQRYNLYGIQHIPLIQEAVTQTRGIFLIHNNEPIVAMFDSCCGGIIPADIADFDFAKVPYLARSYPCTFCKTARLYSWQVAYTHYEFERLLLDNGYALQPLTDIAVSKKDTAGLVQEVHIKNRKKSIKISGKQLYSLHKNIRSYCFTIQKKGAHICIDGKGFGHHLGLCQWGARQMIDEGYSYRDILRFYYPGTKFAKISDT